MLTAARPVFYSAVVPMKSKIVIGLHGKAGSGKDTVADYMVQNYGFTKLSFAGPLKSAVCELFALDPGVFENRILKEQVVEDWGKSPRWLAQWLGADILRNQIDEAIFVKNMVRRIGERDRVVISDVRFANEADMVHELGGRVWKLDAGARLGASSHIGTEEGAHITEKELPLELVDTIVDTSVPWNETKEEVDCFFF